MVLRCGLQFAVAGCKGERELRELREFRELRELREFRVFGAEGVTRSASGRCAVRRRRGGRGGGGLCQPLHARQRKRRGGT